MKGIKIASFLTLSVRMYAIKYITNIKMLNTIK